MLRHDRPYLTSNEDVTDTLALPGPTREPENDPVIWVLLTAEMLSPQAPVVGAEL
jgi:hypothetical protein